MVSIHGGDHEGESEGSKDDDTIMSEGDTWSLSQVSSHVLAEQGQEQDLAHQQLSSPHPLQVHTHPVRTTPSPDPTSPSFISGGVIFPFFNKSENNSLHRQWAAQLPPKQAQLTMIQK